MPRLLTHLRIDEVSAVIKGANPGARVMLRKSDDLWGDDNPHLFNSIMLRKAENDDISDENQIDPNDTPSSLLPKLNDMVAAMVAAEPSLSEEDALFHLLHSPHGRKLAEHLNNISKTEKDKSSMPQVDILKVIAITEQGLMAQVTKRDGESYAQSFSRKFENDIDFRKQWRDLTEAKHVVVLGKGMATLTPTSTEVGSSATSDDSAAAVKQLQESAAKNGRSFEEVFTDPANRELAGKTYTSAHR
jgi:hypothetical protein